jgi:tetratricopeptide (TPR) repeat protein
MSKKKKHHQFPAQVSGPASIKQRGLQSFRQNDFSSAIVQWSHLNLETEPALRAALAEAHFRRALAAKDLAVRLSDLQRALELMPNEGRFWYHLGLTHHHANRLDEAIPAYDRAREAGFTRNALSFVRGLAALERDAHIDLETITQLSPGDRAALFPIAALLRREPQAVLDAHSGSWFDRVKEQFASNPMAALWRGLAFIALGQASSASETLAPTGRSYRAGAEAVRAYYHGLALAATGQQDAARSEWRTAAARTPTRRLQSVVADDQLRQLQSLVEANRWAAALPAAQAALKIAPDQRPLASLELIAHNRLASEAIGRSDWPEAIRHWQVMRGVLEAKPDLGPLTPVLHNLAVAYEKTEQWTDAAAHWEALLSRLPKRPAKKSQAALQLPLPVPEFRAWLRRHTLDCYKRAGQPDLAITHYRSLVKANPDDLDLRVELAGALLSNDQEIAARNELKRILAKDAQHIEARLLLAEIHHERGEMWAAEEQMRAVLKTDPNHEVARRGLIDLTIERGHSWFNAGHYGEAKKIYEEALELTPDDGPLLIFLGNTELALRQLPAARQHFDAALSHGDLHTYVQVFECWAQAANTAEAKHIIARAEAAGFGTAHFYVDIADVCFKRARPTEPVDPFSPPRTRKAMGSDPWERLGYEFLQKAEATQDDRIEMYRHIVGLLGAVKPEVALSYAEKLTTLTPDDVQAWIQLAVLQGMSGRVKVAKDTLHTASRLARKQGNSGLLNEIEQAREVINNPLMSMFSRMGISLDDLADEFDSLDDEDLF